MLTPQLRKLTLTTHVVVSVGWLGAVASFLALSVAGMTARNPDAVRGAYLAMDLLGLYIIVPMSLASLATGLIQSLGTQWGLVRHYWVLTKLLLTVLATGLLLLHQFAAVAVAAEHVLGSAAGTLPNAGRLGIQLVVDASLAILALLTATTLAVYKPVGLTRYGRRKQREFGKSPRQGGNEATGDGPSIGLRIFLAVLGAIVIVFVVMHLTGLAGRGHESVLTAKQRTIMEADGRPSYWH